MRVSSQLLLTFLLNACWQIVFLAAAVALGARVLRESTMRFQHLLWVSALLLVFCLPLVTTVFVSRNTIFSTAAPMAEGSELSLPVAISLSQSAGSLATDLAVPETHSGIQIRGKLAAVILSLYFLFLTYRSVRLCRAWQRTRRIRNSARVVEPSENLQRIIERCQSAFQIDQVALLSSNAVPVPITVGIRRPLVILPERLLSEADDELLTSAIGHEMVHVGRRDYLLNLLYELIYLPLSFHPAAALVRRRINQTRELSCDEQVADRLLQADVYARSLVRLAGTAPPLGNLAPTITVGIADADILEVRIMSLMNRSKGSGRGKTLLFIAVAVILAVPCVAAAAFTFQFDVTQQDPVLAGLQETSGGLSAPGEKRAKLVYHTEPAYTADEREKKIDASGFSMNSAQQEKRAQEERELKERAERDPEFREKLEQRAREERELKERAEREDQELRERIEKETNAEMRLKLEALLVRRLAERQRGAETVGGYSMDREFHGADVAAAKWAKVRMEQAIQIATSQNPGTVLQCRLIGEREDRVFYHVVILSGSDEHPVTTHVIVNAINGVIVKTEPGQAAIQGGTLNGKAVSLPNPEYPEIARNVGASGSVSVEVIIDESGNVISAKAISGHPLLMAASVKAARAAQFSPTRLSGEPVKVKGVLTYNFVAN